MKPVAALLLLSWLCWRPAVLPAVGEEVLFETTSAYHHIRVVEAYGVRTLSFDDSRETRMSLADPLQGHFEYTEYFHLPWLWNPAMTNVLMIGLGGASTQRSYGHYYPQVLVETAELDPVVLDVARRWFHFAEGPRQRVQLEDGRVFLRRTTRRYQAILLDAYSQGRYGSAIPHHLATREFFELAASHLTTNGVLAYNVMGTLSGWRQDIVGALHHTLKSVFPQVYLFPCRDSDNVVMIATQAPQAMDLNGMRQRALALVQARKVKLPTFQQRVLAVRFAAPPTSASSPALTDDFAPIDGMLSELRGLRPAAPTRTNSNR